MGEIRMLPIFLGLVTFMVFFLSMLGAGLAEVPLSWRYEYDDADRLISKVDPAGRRTKYEYSLDKKGNDSSADRNAAGRAPCDPAAGRQGAARQDERPNRRHRLRV